MWLAELAKHCHYQYLNPTLKALPDSVSAQMLRQTANIIPTEPPQTIKACACPPCVCVCATVVWVQHPCVFIAVWNKACVSTCGPRVLVLSVSEHRFGCCVMCFCCVSIMYKTCVSIWRLWQGCVSLSSGWAWCELIISSDLTGFSRCKNVIL